MLSLTAVREPLAPMEKPWVTPAAALAAEREQLLGCAHVLVVLPGEGARRQDLVCERDEEDANRGGEEVNDILPGGAGQVEAR
jgi:hypothetical protein